LPFPAGAHILIGRATLAATTKRTLCARSDCGGFRTQSRSQYG
jgi:hypothetical protein